MEQEEGLLHRSRLPFFQPSKPYKERGEARAHMGFLLWPSLTAVIRCFRESVALCLVVVEDLVSPFSKQQRGTSSMRGELKEAVSELKHSAWGGVERA